MKTVYSATITIMITMAARRHKTEGL